MPAPRVRDLVQDAERAATGGARIDYVCARLAESLPVNGVGLSVTGGPGRHQRVAATDDVSARIEDLQVLLGQGPCVDAVATGAPVLVADIGEPAVAARWPAFTPAVAAIGVRASFALPLAVGGVRIGAMDLYRDDVGTLDRPDVEKAQDFAAAAVELLLGLQDGAADGHRSTPEDPAASSVVHQATGMVMVQMGAGAEGAFAALRARAYQQGQPLRQVALEVLERRLRFDDLGV